jgi:hypothetical protein
MEHFSFILLAYQKTNIFDLFLVYIIKIHILIVETLRLQ